MSTETCVKDHVRFLKTRWHLVERYPEGLHYFGARKFRSGVTAVVLEPCDDEDCTQVHYGFDFRK